MYYNYTPFPIFCQGQTVPKRTQYAENPEKKCIKPPDNKYPLLSEYTLDPQERQKYAARPEQWQRANAKLVEEHGDVLRRRYEREVARDLRVKVPEPPEISDRLREFSTQEGMLKVLRVSAEKDESAQLERYRAVLGTLAPDSLDKFFDIKYNKPKEWNLLKYQYRTVNRKV